MYRTIEYYIWSITHPLYSFTGNENNFLDVNDWCTKYASTEEPEINYNNIIELIKRIKVLWKI